MALASSSQKRLATHPADLVAPILTLFQSALMDGSCEWSGTMLNANYPLPVSLGRHPG